MKKITTRIKRLGMETKEKSPLEEDIEIKVFSVTRWTGNHGWHMANFRDQESAQRLVDMMEDPATEHEDPPDRIVITEENGLVKKGSESVMTFPVRKTKLNPITREKCKGKFPCKNRGNILHTCPFQIDINNDEKFKCNCCSSCTDQCAMEI